MKKVSLIKLDGRHSHNLLFSHMYKFHSWEGKKEFHDALRYCSQNWGPSLDVETYAQLRTDSVLKKYDFEFVPQWSYLCKYGDQRIYLNDEALSWIKLAEPWKP